MDLFENIIATVLPVNVPCSQAGDFPDFIASLVLAACWTKVESSLGVRSTIERKCLGDCESEVVEADIDRTVIDEK